MLAPLSFSFSTVESAQITVASVLKRTIMPALSRLSPHTAAVTFPSATAGSRSYQRLRSISGHARPSTPQLVTSCHASGGSIGCFAAAAGAAAVLAADFFVPVSWANPTEARRRPAERRARRESGFVRDIMDTGWSGADRLRPEWSVSARGFADPRRAAIHEIFGSAFL